MNTRRLLSLARYNTIVVDVEQYMLISHHNVISYKNRFYHNFTNTLGALRCIKLYF